MKIRHRQSGVELEGNFESPSPYHWVDSGPGGSVYSSGDWEAVPEWVEVTGACEVSDYRDATGTRMLSLYHPETGKNAMHAANGYRLRKVQLDQPLGGSRWAFIVERKA